MTLTRAPGPGLWLPPTHADSSTHRPSVSFRLPTCSWTNHGPIKSPRLLLLTTPPSRNPNPPAGCFTKMGPFFRAVGLSRVCCKALRTNAYGDEVRLFTPLSRHQASPALWTSLIPAFGLYCASERTQSRDRRGSCSLHLVALCEAYQWYVRA